MADRGPRPDTRGPDPARWSDGDRCPCSGDGRHWELMRGQDGTYSCVGCATGGLHLVSEGEAPPWMEPVESSRPRRSWLYRMRTDG